MSVKNWITKMYQTTGPISISSFMKVNADQLLPQVIHLLSATSNNISSRLYVATASSERANYFTSMAKV
jgi:hypothetical protein